MYTECSHFPYIIITVESVRSPHMFLLSTLYPTFYCGNGRTKVRPFLFLRAFGAAALSDARQPRVKGRNKAEIPYLQIPPTFERTGQRNLIDIFQMSAHGNAVGKAGDTNAEGL